MLVPLSTMKEPMALITPPLKDLPLVDLHYHRLFAALDVPTVVTIVLGFLCLEKKVRLESGWDDCCFAISIRNSFFHIQVFLSIMVIGNTYIYAAIVGIRLL